MSAKKSVFWNFEGTPQAVGWHAVLICYEAEEGVFPDAAHWDGKAFDSQHIVAVGESRPTKQEAMEAAYENDPDSAPQIDPDQR